MLTLTLLVGVSWGWFFCSYLHKTILRNISVKKKRKSSMYGCDSCVSGGGVRMFLRIKKYIYKCSCVREQVYTEDSEYTIAHGLKLQTLDSSLD